VPLALHHVAIQCADLAACERFYREVLGLEVARRWPLEPEPAAASGTAATSGFAGEAAPAGPASGSDRSVWLATGPDAFLALERAEAPARPGPWRDGQPGLHLLALRIGAGQRAAWEARLAAAGVPVVHRTRWTLYVRDPEGNRIGLSHHPEDAP
jgi:catechol 2,3-dioxygenase-like lactoylglutathione lyase family enzyme